MFSNLLRFFFQIYAIFNSQFCARFQYRVASLYNLLLREFSSNQFETSHRCYKHFEDAGVIFSRHINIFDKITAQSDIENGAYI